MTVSLSRKRFRRWLEAQRRPVGESNDGNYCPVAQYLMDQIDPLLDVVEVDPYGSALTIKGVRGEWIYLDKTRALPPWAVTFSMRIDLAHDGKVEPVSPIEALAILDLVEAELPKRRRS